MSFSSLIPKDLKLLFIDCMEIIWVTILSTVANKDREGKDGEGGDDADFGEGKGVAMEMEVPEGLMAVEQEREASLRS